MSAAPTPNITEPARLEHALAAHGYAVLDPAGFAVFASTSIGELEPLRATWNALPPDHYLRDGGRYRRRRHACFIARAGTLSPTPHRAHWQPLEYNALHGGLERWFEPIDASVVASPAWQRLLIAMGRLASALKGAQPWYLEAHQFRIDTTDGIGRPTPEGAHRDGVGFVAVALVGREGIKGGETRVFDSAGRTGQRFTLLEPWTCLLLDDARVIHESTPIQPIEGYGHRDTLVLTARAGGFQGPGVAAFDSMKG